MRSCALPIRRPNNLPLFDPNESTSSLFNSSISSFHTNSNHNHNNRHNNIRNINNGHNNTNNNIVVHNTTRQQQFQNQQNTFLSPISNNNNNNRPIMNISLLLPSIIFENCRTKSSSTNTTNNSGRTTTNKTKSPFRTPIATPNEKSPLLKSNNNSNNNNHNQIYLPTSYNTTIQQHQHHHHTPTSAAHTHTYPTSSGNLLYNKRYIGINDLRLVRNIREKLCALNLLESSTALISYVQDTIAESIGSIHSSRTRGSKSSTKSLQASFISSSSSSSTSTSNADNNENIIMYCKKKIIKYVTSIIDQYFWLFILIFGQILSFLLACGGFIQALLVINCQLSAPTFTVGLVYFVLSLCLIPLYYENNNNCNNNYNKLSQQQQIQQQQQQQIIDEQQPQQQQIIDDEQQQQISNVHTVNNELELIEHQDQIINQHQQPQQHQQQRRQQRQQYTQQRQFTSSIHNESSYNNNDDSNMSDNYNTIIVENSISDDTVTSIDILQCSRTNNIDNEDESSIDIVELNNNNKINYNTSSMLPQITDDDLNNHNNSNNSNINNNFIIKNNNNNKQYTFLFGIIKLSAPYYIYIGMAIIDVYANYFTVLAFKYTTITSVTLLDALAIPSSMILSKIFLKRKYITLHIFGVLLCMIGVLLNILHDYNDDKSLHMNQAVLSTNATVIGTTNNVNGNDNNFPHKLFGDILAFTGGILFGAGNVLGEVAVRHYGGPNEYIGMLGFFATIICIIQSYFLEYDVIIQFFQQQVHNDNNNNDIQINIDSDNNNQCTTLKAQFLLLSFVFVSVISYLGGARFLQYSEAAFLNLSLLTGDMWSVLFSVISLNIIPKPLFYVALLLTMSGVVAYEIAPSPIQDMNDNDCIDYYHINYNLPNENNVDQQDDLSFTQQHSENSDYIESDDSRYTETNNDEEMTEQLHEIDYTHTSCTPEYEDRTTTSNSDEINSEQYDDFYYTDNEQSIAYEDSITNTATINEEMSEHRRDIV